MTFFSVLQMVFALAVTLGAFGLCVVALRRYGPDLVKKLQATQGPRRLKLVESLMLDQSRRLVLVEVDGEERLILIGPSPRYVDDPPEYVGGFERGDIEGLLDMMDRNYIGWANFLAPAIMKNPERPELGEDGVSARPFAGTGSEVCV